jgi:hypothetical protein
MIRVILILSGLMLMMYFIDSIPKSSWDRMFHECDCNCDPAGFKYDYLIDLKQDGIFVFRDDGREFMVPHDSLDEFIINDNI